ncbi:MAG: mechanosensitive ion channel [Chitinophagaceae bacterium]|nr:mechanosensitive ion channel [Chitinophagaceae bacterium]
MYDFLDKIVWDNTVGEYITIALIILGIYILKKFFSRPLAATAIWLMQAMGRSIDRKAFIDLILEPLEQFLFTFTSVIALSTLNFPSPLKYDFYKTDTQTIVDRIAITLVIISFFRLLLHMIDYLAFVISKSAQEESGQGEHQLVVFFKDFLKAIVFILGILTIIKFSFRYQITELLTGLGIVGAALALSARESLENLIASFIIVFDKPFAVGDTLKVQNITGVVEKIGLRSTRIRTTDKTFASVPNKQMVDSIVDNLTLRTQRKAELRLELKSTTTSQQLQSLLDGMNVILQHPQIENRVLFLSDIIQQGYLVHADYFSAPVAVEDFNALKQEVNLAVIRLMEQLDIEIVGVKEFK